MSDLIEECNLVISGVPTKSTTAYVWCTNRNCRWLPWPFPENNNSIDRVIEAKKEHDFYAYDPAALDTISSEGIAPKRRDTDE